MKAKKNQKPAAPAQAVEKPPAKQETLTYSTQHVERPHKSSYFLPGKAASLTMLYLIDTGCNTNLISKRIFDQLPKHIQDQRMVCDTHGQMADGTRLPFYSVVNLPIKIRDKKLE